MVIDTIKGASTTTAYANAVKFLTVEQANLALSTRQLSAVEKEKILIEAGLITSTTELTTADLINALTNKSRNAEDANSLLMSAGIITAETSEATATHTVTSAILEELVAKNKLSVADAQLIARKANVSAANLKEAATTNAVTGKISGAASIMGSTVMSTFKEIGGAVGEFATAHPILAIGTVITASLAFFNKKLKEIEKEQNELIDSAQTLQEEYRNTNKTLSENISSLEKQKDEFKELSKGVDDYGNNISLSTSEYDKYKSVVSEILGYSPELIEGYDKEGNAIANKNSLIERSIKLLKQEQRQRLKEITTDDKTGEIYEGAKASWEKTEGYEGAYTRNEIARWFDQNSHSNGWSFKYDVAKILGIEDEWRKEGYSLQNAIINNIEVVAMNIKAKKQKLLDLKDYKGESVFTEDEIEGIIEKTDTWQQQYADWQKDIEDAKHGMDDQFVLYAQKADGYDELTDAQKAFVTNYIKATGDIVDADGRILSKDEVIEKANGYTKFVEKLATDPNFDDARENINKLFALDKSKMSAGEYEKQVNAMLKELQDKFKLSDDEVSDFKIALGFTFVSDGKTTVKTMVDSIKSKLQDEFDDKVDDLSLDELKVAYNIMADLPEGTLLSWDELQEKINATSDSVNDVTLSLSSLEKTSDNIGKLSTAYKELDDNGYITIKTLNELQTATGLSGDEWATYETKLLNAKKGSAEFNQAMSDLTYKIIENQLSTVDLTNATDEEVAAIENKIAASLRENGVANASAVAHDAVTKAKARNPHF